MAALRISETEAILRSFNTKALTVIEFQIIVTFYTSNERDADPVPALLRRYLLSFPKSNYNSPFPQSKS
jgi:hypothetical protein